MRQKLLCLLMLAAPSVAGCTDIIGACAVPGIDGIVVEVRDASGNSALAGSMVVARDGSWADTAGPVVPCSGSRANLMQNVALADNRRGDYTVTVSKPHWTTASTRVRVPGDRCGLVTTQRVRLEVNLLPGAPPVRSGVVAPRAPRFGFCGSAAGASAYVDAAPGLPGAVTWHSEDPAVATVTEEGMVHVRSRGTTHVTARSVADPAVAGGLVVQVDPTCAQPARNDRPRTRLLS